MATGFVIAVIAVLVIAGPAGAFVGYRRRRLHASLGSEYWLVTQEYGDPRAARRELVRRARLHTTLRLEAISADDQKYYATAWERTYNEFPDEPVRALKDAAELVRDLLDTRGYPDSQENKLMALLSVKHPGTLVDYRRAFLTLRRAQADVTLPTAAEERVAMVSFRALFDDVLGAANYAGRGRAPVPNTAPSDP
ncbi:MAG TPA: hypothetical protein VGX23_11065 [Actinocrinis sp.]|nr:hypothetical protein [Actinocrinis sp.]